MGLTLVITTEDIEWAKDSVERAKLLFPRFCSHGTNTYLGKGKPKFEDRYLDGVVISREWLKHFERTKGPTKTHGSYGCKHFAEKWASQYVCNGALIAAAAGLGIEQRIDCAFGCNTLLAIKYSSWSKGYGWDFNRPSSKLRLESIFKQYEVES